VSTDPSGAAPIGGGRDARRAKLGLALVVLGILGILWGVFHVLDALPQPERLDFAHRITDHDARESVHQSFFGGVVRALAGLGLALVGGWIRARALTSPEGRPQR